MSEDIRLRFAPSPTGPLHIGGLRTALYNYLIAKNLNGKFILSDRRHRPFYFNLKAEEHIIKSLIWCGIYPDEGPKTQESMVLIDNLKEVKYIKNI